MGRPRMVVPAVVAVMLAVAACSSGSGTDAAVPDVRDTVVVASFAFPESELLGEIYSQTLEADGFAVERSFNVGPRELVLPALVSGLVDFVPEYAGTALQFLSAGRRTAEVDARATNGALRDAVEDLPVRTLAPAPAQDANTFVVDRATAAQYGLENLSDLTTVAGSLVFGGPPECATRPFCLEGLDRVYGITFGEVVSLDAGGPLTNQALDLGGIDVALLFTTDPRLDSPGLVELTDDRGLQPAENITPLVRRDVVARLGDRLVAVVNSTSAHLTTAALRELNEQVASGEDDIATIAARWLDAEGLA
jgi:osmoprotectant transport system substrate-binding protein